MTCVVCFMLLPSLSHTVISVFVEKVDGEGDMNSRLNISDSHWHYLWIMNMRFQSKITILYSQWIWMVVKWLNMAPNSQYLYTVHVPHKFVWQHEFYNSKLATCYVWHEFLCMCTVYIVHIQNAKVHPFNGNETFMLIIVCRIQY